MNRAKFKRVFSLSLLWLLILLIPILMPPILYAVIDFFVYNHNFFLPLSNINYYIGNPDTIIEVIIINRYTDITINLTEPEVIVQFCNIINTLDFERGEELRNVFDGTNWVCPAKYYLGITTDAGHIIHTHFPRGRLFRVFLDFPDKAIISPNFYVRDLTLFDEWFESMLQCN